MSTAAPIPPDARQTDAILWLLAFANFAVGMGAFVVIGILTPVATDLHIGPAQAALLMTVYAIVYALSSPLLVALTGRHDRVRVLTAGMAVFCLGALAASLSPSLPAVLLARCGMALGAGLVTPVAASVALALTPLAQRGRALARVFGGLTLAQALGVPLGAWLGYALGWRVAFMVVAVLAAIALVLLAQRLPRGLAVPVATLASLGTVLRTWRLGVAVSFTAWFVAALYGVYTFLAPLLETRYALGRDGVTAVLVVFGVGAVVGNAAGGWLTDRIGPQRTLVLLAASQLVWLPAVTLLPLPLWACTALIGVWSVCGWAFMVPQQARLAGLSPAQVPVLFALNAAAIYGGSSVGSAVGAATLSAAGLAALGPVGAVLAAVALVSLRATPLR